MSCWCIGECMLMALLRCFMIIECGIFCEDCLTVVCLFSGVTGSPEKLRTVSRGMFRMLFLNLLQSSIYWDRRVILILTGASCLVEQHWAFDMLDWGPVSMSKSCEVDCRQPERVAVLHLIKTYVTGLSPPSHPPHQIKQIVWCVHVNVQIHQLHHMTFCLCLWIRSVCA